MLYSSPLLPLQGLRHHWRSLSKPPSCPKRLRENSNCPNLPLLPAPSVLLVNKASHHGLRLRGGLGRPGGAPLQQGQDVQPRPTYHQGDAPPGDNVLRGERHGDIMSCDETPPPKDSILMTTWSYVVVGHTLHSECTIPCAFLRHYINCCPGGANIFGLKEGGEFMQLLTNPPPPPLNTLIVF